VKGGLYGRFIHSDAILDRLVHDAHRIELVGESLRRKQPAKNQKDYEKIEENI
jgi:DNA replication protein DnaC